MGAMAKNGDSKSTVWNDSVAVVGIAGVLILAGLIAWFYGTGNETAAAGLLNTVIPVVGTIVGLVFGVTSGTKSGTAAGQQAGAAKAQIAGKALSANSELLKQLQAQLSDHKAVHKTYAQPLARALDGANAPELDKKKLSDDHVTEIMNQLNNAISKSEAALSLISE